MGFLVIEHTFTACLIKAQIIFSSRFMFFY